ncbi:MAG: hypothetical protein ABI619_05295, partial [Betaproteobacteria bacterium]
DGFAVYAQTALHDPVNFPGDSIKTSPGLKVVLGTNDLGEPYGVGSGLSISLVCRPAGSIANGTYSS